MEKQKSKASTNCRDKASDYYLDCSCHISVSKAMQSRKAKSKGCQSGRKVIRAY